MRTFVLKTSKTTLASYYIESLECNLTEFKVIESGNKILTILFLVWDVQDLLLSELEQEYKLTEIK